jgi:hypothetical protein
MTRQREEGFNGALLSVLLMKKRMRARDAIRCRTGVCGGFGSNCHALHRYPDAPFRRNHPIMWLQVRTYQHASRNERSGGMAGAPNKDRPRVGQGDQGRGKRKCGAVSKPEDIVDVHHTA